MEGPFSNEVTHTNSQKPVFEISDQSRLKPARSATETINYNEMLQITGSAIIPSSADQTAWLRAHACLSICWSLARHETGFLRLGPYHVIILLSLVTFLLD